MNSAHLENKSVNQNKETQCELLLDNLHKPTQEFDIADKNLRRQLVRRIYFLIMLEFITCIPCIELLILYEPHLTRAISLTIWGLIATLYMGLYVWRDWRRAPPYNYLVYLITSLTIPLRSCLYLMGFGLTRWLHAYPVIIIIDLLVLISFTKQNRLKFSHGMGILLICIVFGLILFFGYIFNAFCHISAMFASSLEAWYIIYDTYLMLSGHHGYNVKPHEYFYAASNIHADVLKIIWMLVKLLIFGPFIRFYKFVQDCRMKDIC